MFLKLQVNNKTVKMFDYLLIHLVSPLNMQYTNFQKEMKEFYLQHLCAIVPIT